MRYNTKIHKMSFVAFASILSSVLAPPAQADFHFLPKIPFIANVPSTAIGSQVAVSPPTTPFAPPPQSPPVIPPGFAPGLPQDRNITFVAVAAVPPPVARSVSTQALISAASAPSSKMSGAIVAENPAQAAIFNSGAKKCIIVSESLIQRSTVKSASIGVDGEETYAFEEPVSVQVDGETDSEGRSEEIVADVGFPSLGTLVATNAANMNVGSSRVRAWSKLDELATEYAYSLAFVGNGLLYKDGKIFATWAIGHAIHQTNELTRGVVNELRIQYQLPTSVVREKKIKYLSEYLKNPTLMELNSWLRLLGPHTIMANNSSETAKK